MATADGASYFLGADGKPSRKLTLEWSQQPAALLAGRLYVAALLPGGIELRSVRRGSEATAAQTLPLPGMAVCAPTPAADGSLFVAAAGSGGGIRRLAPVPLIRQARQLAEAADFQGALELLGLLEQEEEEEEGEEQQGVEEGAEGVDAQEFTAEQQQLKLQQQQQHVPVVEQQEQQHTEHPPEQAEQQQQRKSNSSGVQRRSAAAAAARRQQLEDLIRLRYCFHLFTCALQATTAAEGATATDLLLLVVCCLNAAC